MVPAGPGEGKFPAEATPAASPTESRRPKIMTPAGNAQLSTSREVRREGARPARDAPYVI